MPNITAPAKNASQISQSLRALANPVIAIHSQRFFKTGKGEYGEGDLFLGIRVPVLREQVKLSGDVTLNEIRKLLTSPFHEERLVALLLLVRIFSNGNAQEQSSIYHLYLDNTQYINNWDLVDSSAHKIVGRHLESRSRKILYKLARSISIWERRIAVISTFHFIGNYQFDDTINLAAQLLNDEADLIHKAVGWALREIGKRNLAVETAFLKDHYQNMPRTMLRYAIEKFPESLRKQYLTGKADSNKS